MKLILATHNVHKLTELQRMIPSNYTLSDLRSNGIIEEIPETGKSFTENALQKARFVYNKCKISTLADDSGLEADALNGEPGIFSARYAGEGASSEDNLEKLMHQMQLQSIRSARFIAVLALIINGKEWTFEGVCNGKIATKCSGIKGFGYDPVFIPEGYDCTFAEMDPETKNRISHRGMAVQKLITFLEQLKT